MITKEKIKDLHYSLNGVLSAAQIQSAADDILLEYGKKAKIPGFRQGKIPLSMLRMRYGATAAGEAIDKAMNKDLDEFIANKKIRLAGSPRAEMGKYTAGKDLDYSVEFDILPMLPNIDLEKFTLTKKVAKVSDAEIEKALMNLRKSRAQAEKQDEKYKAADGDVAVIDFKGFVGKDAFEGGEAKKHSLVLGSNSFIPGFEEQLIGHKAGEEFDIKVKFPKEYHAENLAGKEAKFEIKIHELRHHILPELNDEFAKEVGQESVAKLKENIREIIGEQYNDAAKREMRDELLDLLNEKVKLDLPETLVAQELELAKREHEQHEHEHGHAHKFDEKQEQKDAERRVKLGLILAEWGTQNKVVVANEDLQRAIWAEAGRYPDPQMVFEFYNKNPNALSMLRGMLFEQKALDAMFEKVKIKEIK